MHQDVAEPLSQWLGTVDAVRLGRALHALESSVPAGPAPAPQAGGEGAAAQAAADLAAMLEAARAELVELVQAGPAAPRAARQRADHTAAERPEPEVEADFGVHAARYPALQKQIDTLEGLQRERLREVKILDNLQKDIPEKVWLTRMEFADANLRIAGAATADIEVSTFMDNLGRSVFLKDVSLVKSTNEESERGIFKVFEILCTIDRPLANEVRK